MNGLISDLKKSVLLGTEKFIPQNWSEIQQLSEKLQQESLDNEDFFLKASFSFLIAEDVAFNGVHIDKALQSAESELFDYAEIKYQIALDSAIRNRDNLLIYYVLYRISELNKLIFPEYISAVFYLSIHDKSLRKVVSKVSGKRGFWLSQLNESWKPIFINEIQHEDIWETGTIDQRVEYLKRERKTQPEEARIKIEKIFLEENAANRVVFLDVLFDLLSVDDEAFIIKCTEDKSKNVRQKAFELWLKIENGILQKEYLDYITRLITIKEERKFLIAKKVSLVLNENIVPSEKMILSGIDKISNLKDVNDALFWLVKVIEHISPKKLAEKLSISTSDLIDLLLKIDYNNLIFNSLIVSIEKFSLKENALQLLEKNIKIAYPLILMLPKNEQEKWYPQLIKLDYLLLMNYFMQFPYSEIKMEIAQLFLNEWRSQPYYIEKSKFRSFALYFPIETAHFVESLIQKSKDIPQESYFNSYLEEILVILKFKQQLKN